jgi:hypothetical protein
MIRIEAGGLEAVLLERKGGYEWRCRWRRPSVQDGELLDEVPRDTEKYLNATWGSAAMITGYEPWPAYAVARLAAAALRGEIVAATDERVSAPEGVVF